MIVYDNLTIEHLEPVRKIFEEMITSTASDEINKEYEELETKTPMDKLYLLRTHTFDNVNEYFEVVPRLEVEMGRKLPETLVKHIAVSYKNAYAEYCTENHFYKEV